MASRVVLRALLLAVGAAVVLTGVNVGFGGIRTLGLQGPQDFIDVTNAAAFGAQDSHVRFLGGLWLGVGLLFAAGAFYLRKLRGALLAALALIVIGGLARFSAACAALGPSVLPSLIAELALMPALFAWVWFAARAPQAGAAAPQ